MYKLITGMVLILSCAGFAQAGELPDLADTGLYWQSAAPALAWDDYQQSVENNREIVRHGLRTYADRVVHRAGKYGLAVGVLGAAAASTVTDTRMSIGDSRRFAMVLRDSTSDDRSIMFRYQQRW